jgi:hypothetical protein
MSFKIMILAFGETNFVSNGIALATEAEATAYGKDLFSRWTAVKEWKVAESDEPVKYVFADGLLSEAVPGTLLVEQDRLA